MYSGFYIGCYVIESLLQSNLQCFYDQNCVDQLNSYLSSSSFMNVTALDSSLPSVYSPSSSIADLLNNLMIEKWNWSKMYDKYYEECQPSQCSYPVQIRNDAVYIITTLIGTVGGLTKVLKFFLPIFVKFVVHGIQKWENENYPRNTDWQNLIDTMQKSKLFHMVKTIMRKSKRSRYGTVWVFRQKVFIIISV